MSHAESATDEIPIPPASETRLRAASPTTLATSVYDDVKRHDGLIRAMASKFAGRVDFDDLVQIGHLALIEASRSWEARFGASLWTYARRFVFAAFCTATNRRREDFLGEQEIASDMPGADVTLEARELLAHLDDRERRVLALRLHDDLTWDKIGDAIDRSDRDARRIYDEAMITLRERAA